MDEDEGEFYKPSGSGSNERLLMEGSLMFVLVRKHHFQYIELMVAVLQATLLL